MFLVWPWSFSDFEDMAAVAVFFICNHCPYVIHIAPKLSELAKKWKKNGVGVIAINTNDPSQYPEDSPEKMREFSDRYDFSFPYLFDESQEIAERYHAVCTPEGFLFDRERKLYYHGQFCDSRPGGGEIATGKDFDGAVQRILSGKPRPLSKPATGCSIKWKN